MWACCKQGNQEGVRISASTQARHPASGPGWTDARIAEALGITTRAIEMLRQRAVEVGPLAAVAHKKHPLRLEARKFDGETEAQLIALACSAPPEGRQRWSLRLLADRLVELNIFKSVSYETVRRVMKKNDLKPWRKERWCIPPGQSAAFVCAMETVLEVYHRPHDPKRPVVAMDEQPKQLISETRTPIGCTPGATLLGLDVDAYYGALCELADSLVPDDQLS